MKTDKISVILICHKRFRIFEDIIKFWLNQPKVSEVFVMDNSGTFKTDLECTVISTNKNLGPGARVPLVQYANNDRIITCDDDLILHDGIIEDLEKYWDENTICGIMGKLWNHSQYLKTQHINGTSLTDPIKADYVPYNLCLFDRKWFTNYDIFNCPDFFYMDDMWLCEKWKQDGATLLTIPTQNYEQAPENTDGNAMHRRKDLQQMRQSYYDRWVNKKEPLA